ncbi:Eukaryotic translation initiation factor 4E [Symbiodinium microadriaticum]|uniref:Eukaryotic translation initiation factor 4E n=2 Tax=Symbiodinium TaxID=2949 RepID=A0A1Q9DVV2_SYMMI|nr:Eukaryotic translation initiation factor 4E [Symbiodinium microadriaticum]
MGFGRSLTIDLSNEHHPSDKDQALRSKWVLWEQLGLSAAQKDSSQYSQATQRVAAVTTAKEFWRYWNHMPQPSLLLEGKKFMRVKGEARHVVDALMIFKDGIRPEWEDAANAAGGHFTFQLKAVIGGGVIDEYWNNIVLGVIGGSVEPDIVTGLRLVDKLGNKRQPHLRIEVWFSSVAETEKVDKLQQSLEKCMLLRLDGVERQPAWGKVERTSHAPQGK